MNSKPPPNNNNNGHSHGNHHSHGAHCCDEHNHDDEIPALKDSLFNQIDTNKIYCYNETVLDSCKGIIKSYQDRLDTTKFVTSDCDAELLLHIPFTALVKIKSILVWGGPSKYTSPSKMRVIINRDDIDFDNVNELPATQEFELVVGEDGERNPVEYFTRVSKFGGVRNINIHFPSNFGTDSNADGDEDEISTTVYYIGFTGDWTPLVNKPVVAVYEAKPNMADHKSKSGVEFISKHIQ